MHIEFMADRVDAVPTVARWHFDEWGHLAKDSSFEKTCSTISEWLNRDRAPLMLLAIEDNMVVGTSALKPHEMITVFPDKGPWLGSVFVHRDYRHRGIASQLILKTVTIATSIGAHQLFLQTVRLDGGLYARLGWRPFQHVNYRGEEVLVMEKILSDANFSKLD